MTTPEVARALGLSRRTVTNQIRAGRIVAVKMGRDYHVAPEEVERYRAESLGQPGRKVNAA